MGQLGNRKFCSTNKKQQVLTGQLELSILIVQRLALHQNRVKFRQKSIGAIRCGVATSYDDVRHRATSVPHLTNQKYVVGRKNMWFPNWPKKICCFLIGPSKTCCFLLVKQNLEFSKIQSIQKPRVSKTWSLEKP